MGQHSNPQAKRSVSGQLIAAIIAILALIAALTWWLTNRSDSDTQASQNTTTAASSSTQTQQSSSSASPSSQPNTTTSEASSSRTPPPPVPAVTPLGLVKDTLFLLDTSSSMKPFYGDSSAAVVESATAATQGGNRVALWNYSSPMSPGVKNGWRENVQYTSDDQAVGAKVQDFGTGGQPQTRSAVVAAVRDARDQAAASGQLARVVVVTTGTVADMGSVDFQDALRKATSPAVQLSVIHVGDGLVDQTLAQSADYSAVAKNADEINREIHHSTGL